MITRGQVRDGVIVLDEGVQLDEGQEVIVVVHESLSPPTSSLPSHSLLDIAPVSLGPVLRPLGAEDDLLEEMLEDRP